MDPITAMFLLNAGLQFYGSMQRAKAARAAAEGQAGILEENANLADLASADATARGQVAEGRVRLQAGQVEGQQKAAFASSGVDVQSGSALDVLGSTAAFSEFDAQVVRNNAAREAFGYSAHARQFRRQAQLVRQTGQAQADETMLGGVIGGGRSLVPLLSIGGSRAGNIPYGGPSHTDFNDQGI